MVKNFRLHIINEPKIRSIISNRAAIDIMVIREHYKADMHVTMQSDPNDPDNLGGDHLTHYQPCMLRRVN